MAASYTVNARKGNASFFTKALVNSPWRKKKNALYNQQVDAGLARYVDLLDTWLEEGRFTADQVEAKREAAAESASDRKKRFSSESQEWRAVLWSNASKMTFI